MKASHIQENVRALAQLGPEREREARARISAATMDAVMSANRVAWLPIEYDVEITEAVGSLGASATRDWSREAMLKTIDGPLFRAFVTGALNLFGSAAGMYLRLFVRGYSQIYRHCGTLQLIDEDVNSLTLRLVDAPASILKSEAYLEGLAGAFESSFALGNAKGHIDVAIRSTHCDFRCAWSQR